LFGGPCSPKSSTVTTLKTPGPLDQFVDIQPKCSSYFQYVSTTKQCTCHSFYFLLAWIWCPTIYLRSRDSSPGLSLRPSHGQWLDKASGPTRQGAVNSPYDRRASPFFSPRGELGIGLEWGLNGRPNRQAGRSLPLSLCPLCPLCPHYALPEMLEGILDRLFWAVRVYRTYPGTCVVR
jgi:hypothetical protein